MAMALYTPSIQNNVDLNMRRSFKVNQDVPQPSEIARSLKVTMTLRWLYIFQPFGKPTFYQCYCKGGYVVFRESKYRGKHWGTILDLNVIHVIDSNWAVRLFIGWELIDSDDFIQNLEDEILDYLVGKHWK